MGLPPALYHVASKKVMEQVFDAGEVFQFADEGEEEEGIDEDEEEVKDDADSNLAFMDAVVSTLRPTRYALVAKQALEAEQDVFLIDHMWTTTFPQTRKQLREIPGLLQRVGQIHSSIIVVLNFILPFQNHRFISISPKFAVERRVFKH
jgi:hypothetical protein